MIRNCLLIAFFFLLRLRYLYRAKQWKIFFVCFLLLFLNRSGSSNSSGISIDSILKAKNLDEIKLLLQEDKTKKLLKKFCKIEKTDQKIPISCYKLNEKADFWCLNLKLEDSRQLKDVDKALKSPFVSEKCKNYLKTKKELLKYRKKDFFLQELKNYFTD